MSRGFGKWQRLILAELARRDRFYLLELLPVGYCKAQHNALARAAHVLARRDTIDLWRYDTGAARMLCLRPGSMTWWAACGRSRKNAPRWAGAKDRKCGTESGNCGKGAAVGASHTYGGRPERDGCWVEWSGANARG